MDESDSKIKIDSFFGRVDSIDKVANNALSKANMNFDIINNQKILINSINVSIEALETKVRDIANYIIIEKKIEKDAEEDRLFEQQDESQKASMLERLAGLKSNNESEQTQAAGEEPKKGGGGILGTLLTLGIGAFALKFLWPAILPAVGGLLKGALAKFAMFSIGGIGSLIKSIIVGSGLTGISVFGIGKLFQKFGDSAENRGNKVAESASNAIKNFKFNEDGKVDGPNKLEVGGEGGGEEGGEEGGERDFGDDYKKKEEDAFKAAEAYKAEKSNLNIEKNSAVNDMEETLEKKDLKEKKFKVTGEKRNMTKEEKTRFFEKLIESGEKDLLTEKNEKRIQFAKKKIHRGKIGLRDMGDKRYEFYQTNVSQEERIEGAEAIVESGAITPGKFTESATIEKTTVEPVTGGNKDLDLSMLKVDTVATTLDLINTSKVSKNDKALATALAPKNSPNTTVTVVTDTNLKNKYMNYKSNNLLGRALA